MTADQMSRRFLLAGALFCGTGVIAGAFGAHALKAYFTAHEELKAIFQTAVTYQVWHGLGLCLLGIRSHTHASSALKWAGNLFIAGAIIFSGSLFLLVATQIKKFGMITPIGGLSFIAGWICLAVSVYRVRTTIQN